jgi:ribosomal protein S12 methylthiotransferase
MGARDVHLSDAHQRRFLDVLAEEPKAVKYLDMPLQHASQNVLKLMKRGGNRASLERLIEASARAACRELPCAPPSSPAFPAKQKKTSKSCCVC